MAYSVSSFWEERRPDAVQRTSLSKTIRLHWEQTLPGRPVLTYQAGPPRLHKANPSALERAILLLANLYQHLEIEVTPTGRLLALRNQLAILQTWAAVRAELARRSGGEDELTRWLLASVDGQVRDPQRLLASLAHDYSFAFLLPNCYHQRYESSSQYEQAQQFPHFFAATSLWFWERLEVRPAAAGQATLHLSGALDSSRTDLAAVAQQIDAALELATAVLSTTRPEDVHGSYEATYQLDVLTGWPVSIEASVRCYVHAAYSKEYFLRIEQLPALSL